ncbi:hypothetical protein TIFTF001_010573 [Ficus carica]|uniref:Uncharacterized protein n=1 Tax=Ficus carica TaxID=3494 RepID=A0AA88A8W2_FICCA|nr:hypothetical protein TIFTF001_010573 [Ficus carica]
MAQLPCTGVARGVGEPYSSCSVEPPLAVNFTAPDPRATSCRNVAARRSPHARVSTTRSRRSKVSAAKSCSSKPSMVGGSMIDRSTSVMD